MASSKIRILRSFRSKKDLKKDLRFSLILVLAWSKKRSYRS